MSKPSDISQSAWDAACAVVHEIGESEVHDAPVIARAIMAETEACAKKVRWWVGVSDYRTTNVCNEIVNEIEKRLKP